VIRMSNFSQAAELVIKSEMEGVYHHEPILELGATPQYLVDHAGFKPLDLVVTAKVISKACFDHGIATSVIKRLPDIINTPKSLFHSRHIEGSAVVVVTFELHKQVLPIIVPLHPEKRMGRRNCNVVASMYAKEGPDPEVKWSSEGLKIWEA